VNTRTVVIPPVGPSPSTKKRITGTLDTGSSAEKTIQFARPAGPIDELCEQKIELCRSAVDALEIAAALEAEGLGDAAARAKYGVRDVFMLAEHLYARVPRQPAEPTAEPTPWLVRPVEHVLHGLLYALPGLCFAVAAPLVSGPTAWIGLLVSMLCSWAVSQALSYLGYLRLGNADPAGAARLLRGGLVVGLAVVVAAVSGTSLLVRLPLPGMVFGIGQAAYLLAATVLMVNRAERLLLATLAPGVLVSAGFLLLGEPVALRPYAWGALAASAVLAMAAAVWRTRRSESTATRVGVLELRAALPFGLFGLLAGGLLLFPIPAKILTHTAGGAGMLLAVLPLSLSMGAAEWILVTYRRRMSELLRSTGSLEHFAARSRHVLVGSLLRYAGTAGALIALVAAGAIAAGLVRTQWTVVLESSAFLALGCALFVALILQALRVPSAVALLACAGALAVEVAFVAGGAAGPVRLAGVELGVATALFGVLLGYGSVALSRAVRHV
jgi:hypothetical protein